MQTYIFRCERCSGHRAFLLEDHQREVMEQKKEAEKHCYTCEARTNWILAFPDRRLKGDRRAGLDRRSGQDRRGPGADR